MEKKQKEDEILFPKSINSGNSANATSLEVGVVFGILGAIILTGFLIWLVKYLLEKYKHKHGKD